jgi:hypothetical protein
MRDDGFFKNTPRRTLEMHGLSIEFPVLYYDFRFSTCIFAVKTARLQSILPHPRFNPVQMWPGTGMLCITAFEYRDTSIGPYNEVAVSVPINFPPAAFLGRHSAFSMMRTKTFPVYIHQLPVTTRIALDGGVYFYHYPKFLAEIDIEERKDHLEVSLTEGGTLILRLLTRKLPLKTSESFEFHTFSLGEQTIMHTLVEGRAGRFAKKRMGKCGELELGSHTMSDELSALEPSTIAMSGFFGEGAMSKLHAPDRHWDTKTLALVSR